MAKRRKGIIKVRKAWRINPSSRVKKSDRIYKRSRSKTNLKRTIKDETETGNT